MTKDSTAIPRSSAALLGPRTKGLRLNETVSAGQFLDRDPVFGVDTSWPVLTLDDQALDHNIDALAGLCRRFGVWHAPHVKTSMSPELWDRQEDAGAWGATVANPAQLRTVRSWGARRIVLANELVDSREAAWLRAEIDRSLARPGDELEVWTWIDSLAGVETLKPLHHAPGAVRSRFAVLVEVGITGGRTGLRDPQGAVALARSAREAGLRVAGVGGYEGSVASGTSRADLDAVASWCRGMRGLAEILVREGLVDGEPDDVVPPDGVPADDARGGAALASGPAVVLSAGGSSFLDVVLAELPGPLPDGTPTRTVVRSGAYLTHDNGFYSRMNPLSRIGGAPALVPAITVWGQVLSVPEPGLAICGVGRRDVSYDIDLPVAHSVIPGAGQLSPASRGPLPPVHPLTGVEVTALNDQHSYLQFDPSPAATAGDDVTYGAELRPGDAVGFGISHPCTTFDKWRVALLTRTDPAGGICTIRDLVTIDL